MSGLYLPTRHPVVGAGGRIEPPWEEVFRRCVPMKEFSLGEIAGATTVDWSRAPQIVARLVGDVTLAFEKAVNGAVYRLILIEDDTGGRTVTWPADVVFEGGTPSLDTSAENVIFAEFVKTSIGNGGYIGRVTTGALAQP